MESSETAKLRTRSLDEAIRSPRYTTSEASDLRNFVLSFGTKPSDAVINAIDEAGAIASAIAEVNGSGYLGIATFFLGFLRSASDDEDEPHEFKSLSVALAKEFNFDETHLRERITRLAGGDQLPAVEGQSKQIIYSETFRKLWETAIQILRRNTPHPKEKWVAARHIMAATLNLYASQSAATQELNSVGFDNHIVTRVLRNHIRFYTDRDNSREWSRFFKGVPGGDTEEGHTSVALGQINPRREASDDELALDIDSYARAIAGTFSAAAAEHDFVFALYGSWGRGKSTLIQRVADTLCDGAARQAAERKYVPVIFSAWKYPTRPEVWVHLYQTIAQVAEEKDFWQKLRIGFRIGLIKNGWLPLIAGMTLLAVSRWQFDLAHWFFNGIGFIGLLILGSFVWNARATGHRIAQSYFSTPDHTEKLGLQATVGQDLKNLLSVWISPATSSQARRQRRIAVCDFSKWYPARWGLVVLILLIWLTVAFVSVKLHRYSASQPTTDSRTAENASPAKKYEWGSGVSIASDVLLFLTALSASVFVVLISQKPEQYGRIFLIVDDLDRCEPDQMLSVIESLRLFLDDVEVSMRLQIAMLLDRDIFKQALIKTAERRGILLDGAPRTKAKLFREQEEKLFVASLQLPPLAAFDVANLVIRFVDQGYRQQLLEQLRHLDKAVQDKLPIVSTAATAEDMRKQLTEAVAVKREEIEQALRELDADDPPSSVPSPLGQRRSDALMFSDEERAGLKNVLAKVDPSELTPRSVRAFILRYQLIRLILCELGRDFAPSEVLHALAARLFFDPTIQLIPLAPSIESAVEMVSGSERETLPQDAV